MDSIQDADTLADHLYEEGVIAGNVREKVEGCRTAKEKNRVLITAVQQQVGVNQKSFQYFIDALKMDESNEAVLSRLASKRLRFGNKSLTAIPPPGGGEEEARARGWWRGVSLSNFVC